LWIPSGDARFQSLNFGSPHFKYFIPPKSITTLWRIPLVPSIQDKVMSLLGDRTCFYTKTKPWRFREQSDRPGFSSFLVTFFFSLHKEKKKVTVRFEIKEELKLKRNLVF
jgi:hypothetical protein